MGPYKALGSTCIGEREHTPKAIAKRFRKVIRGGVWRGGSIWLCRYRDDAKKNEEGKIRELTSESSC